MTEKQLVSALKKVLVEEKNPYKNNAPWWSKNMMVMGPVAFGFLLLLSMISGVIPFPVIDKIEEVKAEQLRIKDSQNTMTLLLRAICINTARAEDQIRECLLSSGIPNSQTVSFSK